MTKQMFACDVCLTKFNTLEEAQDHESKCKDAKAIELDEYEIKIKHIREKAVNLGLNNPAFRLLVKNGYLEEAREIASKIYWDYINYDTGSSSMQESFYTEMIDSAQHAPGL